MQLFCYWPESDQAEIQFGSIKVMVESESAEHLYTWRRIRLTNTKVVCVYVGGKKGGGGQGETEGRVG